MDIKIPLLLASLLCGTGYATTSHAARTCPAPGNEVPGDTVISRNRTAERDTVAADLEEVVVKSRSIVRKGNLIEMYPTRRDRRFAAGGMDVLSNMHLPEIETDPLGGGARTSDGEPIAMFIDYQPASAQQLRDLRPQDIQRIDFVRSPDDPRFNGARVVANFIMRKYEYGGYTKLDGTQYVPAYSGDYGLYSKFSVKRMTYDVSAGTSYHRHGDNSGSEEHSSYSLRSGVLERDARTESYRSRGIRPRVSARAVYSAPGISVANLVGFNFSRTRPQDYRGSVTFSDIFESQGNSRTASRYSRSAVWNGNLYKQLGGGMSLNVTGSFDWGENSDNSVYTLSGTSPVANDISEDILNANGGLTLSRQLGRHALDIYAHGGWRRNRLHYRTSQGGDVYYREGYGQAGAQLGLRYDGIMVTPSFRLALSSENVDGTVRTRLLPKAYVPFYFQVTNPSSLSGSFEFAMGGPDASQISPVLVRQNEIDAVRGNDDLGNYTFYNGRLGYSYYFGPWLSARLEAGFNYEGNILVPVYTAEYPEGSTPLMVRDVTNDGSRSTTSLNMSLSGNYLDNRLTLRMTGTVSYFAQRGYRHRDEWAPSFWVMSSYYLGDFRINGYFAPNTKSFSQWGDYESSLFWYIGASYSYRDLYVDLKASNPFRKSYVESRTMIDSGDYTMRKTSYSPAYHQSLWLTLSYSFGYGKKIDRRDEVGRMEGSQSIILK